MAMVIANPATPVPGCNFLDRLPVEIRLSIYEFFFEGSQVRATLADHPTEDAEPPSIQSPDIILRHSSHLNLLLSCSTIYNEALDTYWSRVVLRLKCPPMIFDRPPEFRPAKLKLDTYCHRLCTSLPQVIKENVRHVRGIALPAKNGAFVEQNPSLTASALVGTFKKLATCEMSPSVPHVVDGIVLHTEDLGDEGFSRFKMSWGVEPMVYLAERYGIDANAGITFLFKGFVKYYKVADRKKLSVSIKRRVSCYPPGLILSKSRS